MTVLRTLLVDGTDLRGLTGVTVNRLDILAPGTRRGNHDVIPGKRGQLGAQLMIDAYSFTVGMTVEGTSEYNMLANLHNIASAVLGTNGLVSLERRIPTGTSTYQAYTANGQFAGFSGIFPEQINAQAIKIELQFVNLDGGWTRTSDSVFVIP